MYYPGSKHLWRFAIYNGFRINHSEYNVYYLNCCYNLALTTAYTTDATVQHVVPSIPIVSPG